MEATDASSDVGTQGSEALLADRAASCDDPRGFAAVGSADIVTVVADVGTPIARVAPSDKNVLLAVPREGEASVVGAVPAGRRAHTKGAVAKAAAAATQAEWSNAETRCTPRAE